MTFILLFLKQMNARHNQKRKAMDIYIHMLMVTGCRATRFNTRRRLLSRIKTAAVDGIRSSRTFVERHAKYSTIADITIM